MKLVISIPTYNRPKRLLRTVQALLPQIEGLCRIEVFDNASEGGVGEELHVLEQRHAGCLRIIRGIANVGMGANITRAVEAVDAEWVWVLGDDDAPADDAVATILQKIEEFPDACMINFASQWSGPRTQIVSCGSVAELCEASGRLSNLLFISTSVFQRALFLKHLRFAYAFNHSLAGFLAPPLFELAQGNSRVVLESAEIVKWQEADQSGSWNMLAVSMGLMTLLELPLGLSDRDFSRLGRWLAAHTLNPRAALRATMLDTPGQSSSYKRYLFRQLRARVGAPPWTGARECVYWMLMGALACLPIGWVRRLIRLKLGGELMSRVQGDQYNRL